MQAQSMKTGKRGCRNEPFIFGARRLESTMITQTSRFSNRLANDLRNGSSSRRLKQ